MSINSLLRSSCLNRRFNVKDVFCKSSVQKVNFSRTCIKMSVPQTSNERDTFHDVFPSVVHNLVTSDKFKELPDVAQWVKKVLEYNLVGGKVNRGLSTVFAYEMLEDKQNVTDENMRLARIMGWCVEMLQAYLVMIDDVMDGSLTRRGVPCWYRLPEVGLIALNDAIFMYSCLFETLRCNFGNRPQYTKMVDLFNETIFQTAMGQYLDVSMAHSVKNDYSLFTIDRFNAIVKYKTGFYTYKLPVCLGLLLTNNTDSQVHAKAEEICLKIGNLFQLQDDYLDCFGLESKTGKAGTDIQEGKCSWLAVNALQRCNANQKKVFTACYGSNEPAHIERIKLLYEELKLSKLYAETEQKQFKNIMQEAEKVPPPLTPGLFKKLLQAIQNRNK